MSLLRSTGAAPALAVAAVITVVLGLAACGSSSNDTPTLSCAAYCATLSANCTAANAQFASEAACTTFCGRARTDPEFWSLGVEGATSGNSLACRTYHGGAPAVANATLHCPHAGPSGANTCGDWCENYCDLALSVCTGGLQLYADRAACTTACAGIANNGVPGATGGDTIQCRITHLGLASAGGAAATTHCPHGQAVATGPCT